MYGRGTEHRDQYKSLYAQTSVQQLAVKPEQNNGPDLTSSLIALPWPQPKDVPKVAWPGSAGVGDSGVVGIPLAESSVLGDHVVKEAHRHPLPHRGPPHSQYARCPPAARARYLNVPYLVGAMAEGTMPTDKRATTSMAMSQLHSEREKELLVQGAAIFQRRMEEAAAWTAARAEEAGPITPSPSPYQTTHRASYAPRPIADSQQQRMRKSVTSSFSAAALAGSLTASGTVESMTGEPITVEAEPIPGGSALHATRFLGVRDPNGTRRFVEVDTTGGPVITLPLRNLRPQSAPAGHRTAPMFVPSHPQTRAMDEDTNVRTGVKMDLAPKPPIPRQQWPTDAPTHPIMVHQRKSFAGDFTADFPLGESVMREYKIAATKVQAAAAKEAWAAQMTAVYG